MLAVMVSALAGPVGQLPGRGGHELGLSSSVWGGEMGALEQYCVS